MVFFARHPQSVNSGCDDSSPLSEKKQPVPIWNRLFTGVFYRMRRGKKTRLPDVRVLGVLPKALPK
jgi:hypothetical protein